MVTPLLPGLGITPAVVLGERPLPGATVHAISCARNERLLHDLVEVVWFCWTAPIINL